MGTAVFANEFAIIPSGANRHLLLELCAFMNTLFEADTRHLVTSYNVVLMLMIAAVCRVHRAIAANAVQLTCLNAQPCLRLTA